MLLMIIPGQKDAKFIEQVYLENRQMMWFTAQRILHRADYAEEAMQAAVEQIIKHCDKLKTIKDKQKIKSYVSVVMRNIALKCYNQHKKITTHEEVMNESLNYLSSGANTETLAIDNLTTGAIQGVLKDLPIYYRDTLLLYYLYGYRLKEVAELMGCSPNTVESRRKRAIAKIRHKLLKQRGRSDDEK